MSRQKFILDTVRALLQPSSLFDVVRVRLEEPAVRAGVVEAFPYILDSKLQITLLEDGKLADRVRFVDIGILFRWTNAGGGLIGDGAEIAGNIEAEAEELIARFEDDADSTGLQRSYSDSRRKYTIQQLTVTECLGYLDNGREAGETAAIVTASIVTERLS